MYMYEHITTKITRPPTADLCTYVISLTLYGPWSQPQYVLSMVYDLTTRICRQTTTRADGSLAFSTM